MRRRRRLIEFEQEYKQLQFNAIEEHVDLTGYFRDGWYVDAQIICPPMVILVFCREQEVGEKEASNE
jgi:hypothetical protein